MRSLLRRLFSWTTDVFTWEACGTICAYTLVALMVGLFVDNTTARYSAQDSLATSRSLSSHRITTLTDQIDGLSNRLAAASKDQGELLAEIRSDVHQLRRLGVTPDAVTTPRPVTSSSTPRPTRSPRPKVPVTPSPTPSPSPSPSPKRTRRPCGLLDLHCRLRHHKL
jgi:hypothetical protein